MRLMFLKTRNLKVLRSPVGGEGLTPDSWEIRQWTALGRAVSAGVHPERESREAAAMRPAPPPADSPELRPQTRRQAWYEPCASFTAC